MRKVTIVILVFTALAAALAGAVTTRKAAEPGHVHGAKPALAAADVQPPAAQLARGRLATAKYATSLARAKADGYGIITRMIPDMGWHG